MNDTIKGALLGSIITTLGSFAIFFLGNFSTQDTIEKNTVEILSNYFNSVEKDMSYKQALQTIYKENETIKEENDFLKSLDSNENKEKDNKKQLNDSSKTLNDIPVFNCQYYDYDSWNSSELYEWQETDKAANGEHYKDATHMAISGAGGNAQTIIIDYLLEKKYIYFSGCFQLDEISKSTATIATLNIYGDDKIIYTCKNITGGIVPQNTHKLSIKGAKKLRFEFISEEGELGNRVTNFGVVFYNTILK